MRKIFTSWYLKLMNQKVLQNYFLTEEWIDWNVLLGTVRLLIEWKRRNNIQIEWNGCGLASIGKLKSAVEYFFEISLHIFNIKEASYRAKHHSPDNLQDNILNLIQYVVESFINIRNIVCSELTFSRKNCYFSTNFNNKSHLI